jgi:aminomethyltransferase
MCLYGHDLDENTTPVEAGLTWVIGEKVVLNSLLYANLSTGKNRRENPTFIGAEGVMEHLKNGPPRRRVGLVIEGAPARGKGCRAFCLQHS